MPINRLTRWLLLPALAQVGYLAGCVGDLHERLDVLSSQMQVQQEAMARLRNEITDGFTMALCSPELRQLLENVQRECTSIEGDQQMCTTKQIRPAVIAADPEHRGRFLKMMSHLPHEVVYVPLAAREVPLHRLDRLGRMARRALLGRTVFLVVTSPESGEEESIRRAVLVESLLTERGVPVSRIKRWVYTFPATRSDIERSSDQPGLGETRDLFRGVWIFRADC